MRLFRSLFLFSFCLLLNASHAQLTDNELWTSASVRYKVNKKWRVDMEENLRFNFTNSSLRVAFTEVGGRYTINKRFNARLFYRYNGRPGRFNSHRLGFDFSASLRDKDFPLSAKYRFRFQNVVTEVTGANRTNLRHKIGIKHNLSKLVDPWVSGEAYHRLNGKNEIQKLRLTIGATWRANKRMDINTFYRLQQEVNVRNPLRQNIFGLGLEYDLKFKKKKKPKDPTD